MTTVYTFYMVDTNSATIGVEPVTVTSSLTTSIATRITVAASSSTSAASTTSTALSPSVSAPTGTRSASYAASSEPHSGQLIGIILGSVLGACVLITIFFYCCWRWNRKRTPQYKFDSEKNITDDSLKPIKSHRLSFRLPAQRMSNQWASNLQEQWQRYPHAEDIGVAVTYPERHSFLKRMTRSAPPPPRSLIPTISAPVLADQVSVRGSLEERLFAEPTPYQNTQAEPVKHTSEATTIRTSGHPSSTASRPPITILRRWSTSTSIGTSFEEDKDHHSSQAPPVPTFTAVGISVNGTSVGRAQSNPTRSNLEAGIKRSVTKALSTMPLTPSYDNGYFRNPRGPVGDAVPASRLNPTKSMDIRRPYMSSQTKPTAPTRSTAPAKITKMTPIHSPHSSYPEIPERDSSRRSPQLRDSDEWLVPNAHSSSKPSKEKMPRLPPLAITNDRGTSLGSPIRNLMYPRVPTSASELQSSSTTRPADLTSDSLSSTKFISPEEAQHRLEQGESPTDCNECAVTLSNNNHIADQLRQSSANYGGQSLSANKGKLHLFPPSGYIPPPKATLTPNRTTTGDLVLLVDM